MRTEYHCSRDVWNKVWQAIQTPAWIIEVKDHTLIGPQFIKIKASSDDKRGVWLDISPSASNPEAVIISIDWVSEGIGKEPSFHSQIADLLDRALLNAGAKCTYGK